MTGALILSGNPTVDNGAANKKYIDDAITAIPASLDTRFLSKIGTVDQSLLSNISIADTKIISCSTAATTANHLTNKTYVDSAIASKPFDSTTADGLYLKKTGLNIATGEHSYLAGTILVRDPVFQQEPTSKLYVDAAIASIPISNTIMLRNGSLAMTGDL
jgi:hypothetical protein